MSILIFWMLELKLEDNQNQGLFNKEPKVNQNRRLFNQESKLV
jgi:hypothetical protein